MRRENFAIWLPIYQEQTVDRDLFVEGKRELTEYLQSKGYFEAQVDFDQSKTADQEELIEYSLFPGERHKLVAVEIEGNKYFSDETLRERMYTVRASFLRFRHGRFSQDFLRRDANAVRALYQSNGFRDVEVTTRVEDDYQGKKDQQAVFLTVSEGPQWFVSSLSIEGVDNTTTEDLRAMTQSSEGQPFSGLKRRDGPGHDSQLLLQQRISGRHVRGYGHSRSRASSHGAGLHR